ncbi:hypothetical protein GIB67_017767 [Kingdonia uniflora]|uniref:Uncharacterized protein n=1 Tax=Kingdonia uniflora TaxID=39325 RepID=A0A7J7LQC7_9MAGN|nr:hypothetical protein GIB67_017767 [Kingdonia uniflora]
MPVKYLISWNTVIHGYFKLGEVTRTYLNSSLARAALEIPVPSKPNYSSLSIV